MVRVGVRVRVRVRVRVTARVRVTVRARFEPPLEPRGAVPSEAARTSCAHLG